MSHHRNEEDEVDLMRRVALRDRSAFALLYDALSGQTYGVIAQILGQSGQAEEVLQEVFLEIWQGAESYDSRRGTPRQWVLTKARSRALDRLRSSHSSTRREERTSEQRPTATEPIGTRNLEAEERRRKVQDALAELPDSQRRCIELAFFRGMTQTEVAAELDAPLGTVKSRILLGMRKIRAILQPSFAECEGSES